MGYYKGSNFLRANKRWFGIPGGGPSKKSLYECSYVKGADGYYYYWAPSYRSAIFGANNSTDYLYNQTSTDIFVDGYTIDGGVTNNRISFYEVAEQTLYPCIWTNGYFTQKAEKYILPGGTFTAPDGNVIVLNNSTEPKLVSECESVRLLIPTIKVYGITCTKNGLYNNWKSPLVQNVSNSKIVGLNKFAQAWNTNVGTMLPVDLKTWVDCEEFYGHMNSFPKSYTFSYNSAGTSPNTYNYSNQNDGFRDTSYRDTCIITQANTFVVGFDGNQYLRNIDYGEMIADKETTSGYNQMNASHFPVVYCKHDVDLPSGERFWGYLSIIEKVDLQLSKLHV